jgi:hypothetical protein
MLTANVRVVEVRNQELLPIIGWGLPPGDHVVRNKNCFSHMEKIQQNWKAQPTFIHHVRCQLDCDSF